MVEARDDVELSSAESGVRGVEGVEEEAAVRTSSTNDWSSRFRARIVGLRLRELGEKCAPRTGTTGGRDGVGGGGGGRDEVAEAVGA